MVTTLDPLRELDLLRGGQEVDLADVLQEELQRVGRELAVDALLGLLDRGGVEVSLGVDLRIERSGFRVDLD
jgi:hypothetical protein